MRKVLDDTALAIDRASRAAELVDPDAPLSSREKLALSIEDDAKALDALHARLLVRLGPLDDITLSLGEAIRAFRGAGDQVPIKDNYPDDVESERPRPP